MAAAERKNNDEWKKRHLIEKAELERKVKLAEPEIRRALDAVSIFIQIGFLEKNYFHVNSEKLLTLKFKTVFSSKSGRLFAFKYQI